MYTVLIVFQVLLAAALVAVVLVQRGPGATMGAAFGSGASGTVFGSRGSAGFLTKLTSWLGVAFFAISLAMAVIVARSGNVTPQAEDLGVAGQLVQPTSGQADEAGENAVEASESGGEEFLEVPVEEETADSEEEPPEQGDTQEPPSVD